MEVNLPSGISNTFQEIPIQQSAFLVFKAVSWQIATAKSFKKVCERVPPGGINIS